MRPDSRGPSGATDRSRAFEIGQWAFSASRHGVPCSARVHPRQGVGSGRMHHTRSVENSSNGGIALWGGTTGESSTAWRLDGQTKACTFPRATTGWDRGEAGMSTPSFLAHAMRTTLEPTPAPNPRPSSRRSDRDGSRAARAPSRTSRTSVRVPARAQRRGCRTNRTPRWAGRKEGRGHPQAGSSGRGTVLEGLTVRGMRQTFTSPRAPSSVACFASRGSTSSRTNSTTCSGARPT